MLRLLLVEDDAVDRLAIRRALKQAGVDAEIVEAHTASEAVAAAHAGGIDLVLLDYQLPGGDGMSVLAELRRGETPLPVIVLTGFGDEQLAADMMKSGAADYLSKRSLTPETLERSLRHALAMERAERERRLLLAREQQAREEAQAANRAKDEFLATLSHELRTPLNAILGWARLIARDALEPERIARAVAIIERNALLQVKLIDDLLDVSRIVSDKLTFDRTAVDLAAVVAGAVESARPDAEARGLKLSLERDEQPLLVLGDGGRLQQVTTNLLSNAIKFTPAGGEVRVLVARRGEQAELVVADSGEGVDPAYLPRMFQRFSQADRRSRRYGGLGLGLSIVRHIVEFHGGTVTAASAGPGQGTTITVSLPVGAELPALAPSSQPPAGSLDGLRVLVVDDHDDGREMIAIALEQCGASVRRAGSATDAVMEALLDTYDVLVSDIAMPGEDGYALLAQLRQLKRAPFRAVALTAFATAEHRALALNAGFDAHVAKPVDPQLLVETLRQLVPPHTKA